MVVGYSPRFSANSALLRLCHLQRVPEACERVTDLFWRRLERCAASKPHENRISPSWPLKRGNEAVPNSVKRITSITERTPDFLLHVRWRNCAEGAQTSGPPNPNPVGLHGAPWTPQIGPPSRLIEKERFDGHFSNKVPVNRPK